MANEANLTSHTVNEAGHQQMSAQSQVMRTSNHPRNRRAQYPLSIMGGDLSPTQSYCLFLMVNITLFLRPAELIPALANLPIYEVLILSSLFLSIDQVKRTLQFPMLKRQPITLCVFGILAAVALSHASHMYLYGIRTSTIAFLKYSFITFCWFL